jgi:hypothetical protein
MANFDDVRPQFAREYGLFAKKSANRDKSNLQISQSVGTLQCIKYFAFCTENL